MLKNRQTELSQGIADSFGKKLKKLIFPLRWIYILLIVMWIYGTFLSSFSKSNGFLLSAMIYAIFFIVPIAIIEIMLYANKHYKHIEHKQKKTNVDSDKYINPRRVLGLLLIPVTILFAVIGVIANRNSGTYSPNNMYPSITVGVICLIILLSSIGDPKTKTELAEKIKAKQEKTLYFKNESLKTVNVSCVDGMDGHEFEYFCAELLQKNGFSNVKVTPGSGDQGVDILAEKLGIKYAIQCKNYISALGNTPVQEVFAGKQFYNCHVGVVLTNSTFTPGAKNLAEATGVLLWDRTDLQKMMDIANMV